MGPCSVTARVAMVPETVVSVAQKSPDKVHGSVETLHHAILSGKTTEGDNDLSCWNDYEAQKVSNLNSILPTEAKLIVLPSIFLVGMIIVV